jgi:hypothetical protein
VVCFEFCALSIIVAAQSSAQVSSSFFINNWSFVSAFTSADEYKALITPDRQPDKLYSYNAGYSGSLTPISLCIFTQGSNHGARKYIFNGNF